MPYTFSPSAPPTPLVLVVEDDARTRGYVCECLAALPVRLAEAADGVDALARLEDGLDDGLVLVVTDLLMPRMGGRALRDALHADARWADVPVLLVTGEATPARDGPVLRKPFNGRRLRAAVHALLPR